jgi:hypothetical protein
MEFTPLATPSCMQHNVERSLSSSSFGRGLRLRPGQQGILIQHGPQCHPGPSQPTHTNLQRAACRRPPTDSYLWGPCYEHSCWLTGPAEEEGVALRLPQLGGVG